MSVNPWVLYFKRGKRRQEKNRHPLSLAEWLQTLKMPLLSLLPLFLSVLHLTTIYRICMLGTGNMETKETRHQSLVLQGLHAIRSTQSCWWWPWPPCMESAPGLSLTASAQSIDPNLGFSIGLLFCQVFLHQHSFSVTLVHVAHRISSEEMNAAAS